MLISHLLGRVKAAGHSLLLHRATAWWSEARPGLQLTIRRPHSEAPAVKLVAAAVAVFGCFVHKLVEGGVDVVRKLYLCHWGVPIGSCPDAKSHNALQCGRHMSAS